MNPEMIFSEPGNYTLSCAIPPYFFKKGIYGVDVGLKSEKSYFNTHHRTLIFFINLPELLPKDQWFKDAPFDVGPVFKWNMIKNLS
jgi:hypothetical protein